MIVGMIFGMWSFVVTTIYFHKVPKLARSLNQVAEGLVTVASVTFSV